MRNDARIQLYILNTEEVEDPREHPEWERVLLKRWKKAVLPVQLQDRKNSAGAGWLLWYVFFREGIPFSMDAFFYGKHGKPYHDRIHFNLSHSGEYVICAVGEAEIGCDIQKIRPCRASMVQRFFSEEEQEYIFSVEGKEREERFITIWTRKESYLKKTGEGLTKDLRKISCLHTHNFYEIKLEGYVACICSAGIQDLQPEQIHVEYVDAGNLYMDKIL